MIRGVIFDLDGTLIDSMMIWSRIDRQFLSENGIDNPPADVSDKVKKMTMEESARYFIEQFGISCTVEYVIDRIEELVRIEYEENIVLKPYVAEILDFLDDNGIEYGVATATYRTLAEAVMKRCGIYSRMKYILTDQEFPLGKKFPDIYLSAAEKMGLSPEETLVAEDSLHCVKTSVGAGFLTVGVHDELSDGDKEEIINTADYYINSLEELKNIIRNENK